MKIKQILFATLCIICSSCNNEYDDTFEFKSEFNSGYNTRSLNNSEENTHPLIEGHYVEFINNQYVINITKEEAVERGISEESYDELFNSITVGNRLLTAIIDSCKNTGKKVVVSTCIYDDNNEAVSKYSISRIKTRNEAMKIPSGRITTTGQEYGKYGFFVPSYIKSINFDCYSKAALLPMQIVIAETWDIQDIKSGIGQHVTMNARFSVTNVNGGVQYATSDSNGGTCAWVGSTN